MYRDFSENSKQRLLGLVSEVENEKLSDFTDWIGDRWYDFEEWIGILNIRNYLNNVNMYHRMVIDKNNTTKDVIESIFGNVKYVNTKHFVEFTKYYVQLEGWRRYMEELSEIVNPINGKFTSEYMTTAMENILEENSSHVYAFEKAASDIHSELIEFDATSLVLDSRDSGKDALLIGWTSDFLKNILSLFHISEAPDEIAVRKSITSVIKELLENKHEASDFFDKMVDALSPEELEWEKKILKYFVETGKMCTESELEDLLNIDIREYSGSESFEWLMETLNKKENLKFLSDASDKIKETLGAYGDAVDTYEIATELMTKVFNDYTEDTKYLKAIKQALIEGGYDNKKVNEVVDSMLWEYQNQYISAAHDGIKKLAEMGAEKVVDNAIDKFLPLLDTALKTKDITSKVLGLSDAADEIANIYATQQYSYALVDKYEELNRIIKSGTYTQDDVAQRDMYFKLAKTAKIQEYKSIKSTLEDALKSDAAMFASAEDKQYTRDIIVKTDAEIRRLEGL